MKRFVKTGLIAMLISGGVALMLPSMAHAELKIGVVVTPRLLSGTDAGKAAAETLKKQKEVAQEKLDKKAGELKAMQEDLSKRAMLLSDTEKAKARDEFDRRQREATRMKEDLERDLQRRENTVLGEVNRFLNKVIVEFGEKHDYDLIVDASATLFFSELPDITDEVIAAANEAQKKGD